MTTQHTPGPWRVIGGTKSGSLAVVDHADDAHVAEVSPQPDKATLDTAHLIAAAPDLLAALRIAFHMLPANADPERCAVIRAAIAKAEGT